MTPNEHQRRQHGLALMEIGQAISTLGGARLIAPEEESKRLALAASALEKAAKRLRGESVDGLPVGTLKVLQEAFTLAARAAGPPGSDIGGAGASGSKPNKPGRRKRGDEGVRAVPTDNPAYNATAEFLDSVMADYADGAYDAEAYAAAEPFLSAYGKSCRAPSDALAAARESAGDACGLPPVDTGGAAFGMGRAARGHAWVLAKRLSEAEHRWCADMEKMLCAVRQAVLAAGPKSEDISVEFYALVSVLNALPRDMLLTLKRFSHQQTRLWPTALETALARNAPTADAGEK